ncbi:MAG: 6-hydroxymethylpterin diphosphokinase MptE-like protein [Spirochaetota bacterium]
MAKYKIADTPAGSKTLLYINPEDSREVRLHSIYDPLKESERSAGSFNPGRSNLIIIAGLALGYHAEYLRKRFPAHLIIIIEKDAEVIQLARLNNPGAIKDISTVTSTADLPAVFEQIDISTIKGASTYIHRPSYSLNREFYDAVLKGIKEYIGSKVSDLLTRFEFEENWISHIFKNIHHVYTSTPVIELFGRFRGMPGIIVSAGPSLKKNARLLNSIRDRALIVCVDTAFKVLHRMGVVPHIVMTLDSQKYSLKHFLGIMESGSVLLADMVCYPRLVGSYPGEKILSTTTKYYSDKNGNVKRETTPIWDWMEEFTGAVGDIQSGGSVATSVFDLLLNLGCSSIVLLGQDLAYTGREIHCSGTYHNDEWLPKTSRFLNLETINQRVIRKRKIKYIEGYKGKGKVVTDFVFDIYRNWFRDSAARVNIPVINATEGGARIENTVETPLGEILQSTKTQPRTPDQILKAELGNKSGSIKKPVVLLDAVNKAIAAIEDIKRKTSSGISSDEEMLNIINNSFASKLITPFLRRVFVYFARHPDLPQQKASELLMNELNATFAKLTRMLGMCKQNLQKIR